MEPEIPLEVWLAKVPWGKADHERPVVFIGHRRGGKLVILPVSSQLDLRVQGDFLIRESDPAFAATGLTRTSYVRGAMIELRGQDFVRRMGQLAGSLRMKFEEWLQDAV